MNMSHTSRPQRFVLMSTQKSGTNFVQGILGSRRDVTAMNELFLPTETCKVGMTNLTAQERLDLIYGISDWSHYYKEDTYSAQHCVRRRPYDRSHKLGDLMGLLQAQSAVGFEWQRSSTPPCWAYQLDDLIPYFKRHKIRAIVLERHNEVAHYIAEPALLKNPDEDMVVGIDVKIDMLKKSARQRRSQYDAAILRLRRAKIPTFTSSTFWD
ncbi:hypothetical protein CTAYLR_005127 [Chrysophaeum taylorii]|uniref:Uncharacterized protein n=1 Tax=Chrysophaeum taylorii TaxID=2483200 RepID=A0AAD7XPG2_9STRA|nr:hypothetical protein CTAYLR_005127 [Chrysophaeum taylorii]